MQLNCPYCSSSQKNPSDSRRIIKFGVFYRKSDSRWVQRYRCLQCQRGFSRATLHPCYRQNKRLMNEQVRKLISSGNSLRRTAMILNLNRKTVVRKLLFLETQAAARQEKINRSAKPASVVEFDDLITIEHTKLKPLAVTLMVEQKSRRILGFEVSRIPASGHLAKLSVKKYGPRKDGRAQARAALFERLKPLVAHDALIKSDKEPHYAPDVKRHFPSCRHETFKGRRSCVAGQGELKRIAFDPIFSINHTFAMLRANINRLLRRTWCTTKRPDRLAAHLMVYMDFHNECLIRRI